MSIISLYKKTQNLEANVKRKKGIQNLIAQDLFYAYKTGGFQHLTSELAESYLKQINLWARNLSPRRLQYNNLPEEYSNAGVWDDVEQKIERFLELQLPIHPEVTKEKVNEAIKYLGYEVFYGNSHIFGGQVNFSPITEDLHDIESPFLRGHIIPITEINRLSIECYIEILKEMIRKEVKDLPNKNKPKWVRLESKKAS